MRWAYYWLYNRLWYLQGRARFIHAAWWWRWKTRKLPRTRITLAHRDDRHCFMPGMVIGTSTSDSGQPSDCLTMIDWDDRDGSLVCVQGQH